MAVVNPTHETYDRKTMLKSRIEIWIDSKGLLLQRKGKKIHYKEPYWWIFNLLKKLRKSWISLLTYFMAWVAQHIKQTWDANED